MWASQRSLPKTIPEIHYIGSYPMQPSSHQHLRTENKSYLICRHIEFAPTFVDVPPHTISTKVS
jgi:hypothetical protein